MSALEDGTYDVMVVEADERAGDAIALELAVVSGEHRGEVVQLIATRLGRSWIDLLGSPGTLTVAGGEPSFAPG